MLPSWCHHPITSVPILASNTSITIQFQCYFIMIPDATFSRISNTTVPTLPSKHYQPNAALPTQCPDASALTPPSQHYHPNAIAMTLPSKCYRPNPIILMLMLPSQWKCPDASNSKQPFKHYPQRHCNKLLTLRMKMAQPCAPDSLFFYLGIINVGLLGKWANTVCAGIT